MGTAAADPAPTEAGRFRWAVWAFLAIGMLVWLAGSAALWVTGISVWEWNHLCALAALSFLGAIVMPVPGLTTGWLLILRSRPILASFGVIAAAAGGTLAAALIMVLGDAGRTALRRHAEHSRWSRRVLSWSVRLAQRWTYFGIFLLLIPPFLPRAPVLYAASLIDLRKGPYLAAVFLGTLVRNGLVLTAILAPWY